MGEVVNMPEIRKARDEDHHVLAQIWNQGWHDAHAAHVPQRLTDLRTKESFYIRLQQMLAQTFVSGPIGAPIGFCAVKGDEIYQMYVHKDAKGIGVAAALISAGCENIAQQGFRRAKLDVIAQNSRARRFYEKMGWVSQGLHESEVDTLDGPFALPCILMTKNLG
nr:GNAT family N-acetyltransferase [Amylibacter sp.]